MAAVARVATAEAVMVGAERGLAAVVTMAGAATDWEAEVVEVMMAVAARDRVAKAVAAATGAPRAAGKSIALQQRQPGTSYPGHGRIRPLKLGAPQAAAGGLVGRRKACRHALALDARRQPKILPKLLESGKQLVVHLGDEIWTSCKEFVHDGLRGDGRRLGLEAAAARAAREDCGVRRDGWTSSSTVDVRLASAVALASWLHRGMKTGEEYKAQLVPAGSCWQ